MTALMWASRNGHMQVRTCHMCTHAEVLRAFAAAAVSHMPRHSLPQCVKVLLRMGANVETQGQCPQSRHTTAIIAHEPYPRFFSPVFAFTGRFREPQRPEVGKVERPRRRRQGKRGGIRVFFADSVQILRRQALEAASHRTTSNPSSSSKSASGIAGAATDVEDAGGAKPTSEDFVNFKDQLAKR